MNVSLRNPDLSRWFQWAREIQALSQTGPTYSETDYNIIPGRIRQSSIAKKVERNRMMAENAENELLVLWTSGDKVVAMNMVFMYTWHSKVRDWGWDDVTLLIWGASPGLLVEDEDLKTELQELKDAGVNIIACRKCAENLGIVEKLEGLGVKVFYTGEFLTEWLKSGKKLITI